MSTHTHPRETVIVVTSLDGVYMPTAVLRLTQGGQTPALSSVNNMNPHGSINKGIYSESCFVLKSSQVKKKLDYCLSNRTVVFTD